MSNSIWKTPGFHEAIDNKLKVSKDGKWVYWTMYGWNIPGEDVHDIGVEWAYVDDLIAQADKAERLEKENEAMREEFEVWHGNYKCEIEDKERLQKVVFFLTGHLRDVLQLDEYGHIKLDEITKQQIKNAISDPVGIIMHLEQQSNN